MSGKDEVNGPEVGASSSKTMNDLYSLMKSMVADVKKSNEQNSTILEKLDGMQDRQDKLEKRIDSLEKNKKEVPTKTEVRSNFESLKQELDEQKERILRKNNIIIFGIAETEEGLELLQDLMELILPSMRKQYDFERVGDPEKSNNRPVRVYLSNASIKRQALRNCSKLSGRDRFNSISVKQDLTKAQQESAKTAAVTRSQGIAMKRRRLDSGMSTATKSRPAEPGTSTATKSRSDFNVDMGSASRISNRVEVMSQKYGFEQLVKKSTRLDKIIDLCFFKKTRECAVNVVVEDLLVSDHSFVLVESYITTKPNREGGALESNTSEKTKRFMAIRKYHYDFWKRTGLEWHKTKCKEYEKLVRIALKRDMHDMVQKRIARSSVWDAYKSISSIKFKKEEKLPETLCPEKLNNFYCEMGFMAGKPVKDTLPQSIAEKPKDDSFLFYVKNVNQSDLFLAWKRVRRKLSNKPDTMGISKVFLDKLMPIPAFNEALLKIIQKSFVEGLMMFTWSTKKVE
ncbi:unnamed protein product [Orchesella dallaii]|uniref:Uncharacterized protein n=1 Tax=Orchesella dallaii TaxID=48710 RepID=A0ABP1Q409_9HEXA